MNESEMMAGFNKAMKFLADNAVHFEIAFKHAFDTNEHMTGILAVAKATGKTTVADKMIKLAREFYDAGSLSALAVQQAATDHKLMIDEAIANMPPEMRELLKGLMQDGNIVKVIHVD